MSSSYTAGDFYKDEYNRLINKKNQVNTVLNSQARLSALNDSYRKRYAKYIEILMVFIICFAIYLGVSLLQNNTSFVPQLLVDTVIVILIIFIIIYLYFAFITLSSRDVLDYDELDLPPVDGEGGVVATDPASQAAAVGKGLLGPSGESCIGSDCCPTGITGSYWNPNSNKCDGQSEASGFTTLEFSPVESAYKDKSFQDSSLKRAPIVGTVGINPSPTSLTFSNV